MERFPVISLLLTRLQRFPPKRSEESLMDVQGSSKEFSTRFQGNFNEHSWTNQAFRVKLEEFLFFFRVDYFWLFKRILIKYHHRHTTKNESCVSVFIHNIFKCHILRVRIQSLIFFFLIVPTPIQCRNSNY